MRTAYDADEVRALEKPLLDALPEGALMARAATALARRCADLLGRVYGARVVLLVGPGNNGGDALYAGASLARRGARVDAVVAGDRVHEAGLAALLAAGGRCRHADASTDAALVGRADLVVDGLLGIGATGPLRDDLVPLARLTHDAGGTVVAVDVASGVDASTGEVAGESVRADVTVSFGAWKPGLLVDPGAGRGGVVEVVDIGLGAAPSRLAALDADDVAALVGRPPRTGDKYARGVVGVVAGSDRYPGAAVLAVGGAVRSGAGMVRFAGPAAAADLVRARWPESVVTTADRPGDLSGVGRVQAWVVGPGLGTDEEAAERLEHVLGGDLPVLVDADALTVLAGHRDWLRRAAPTLLTPHAGELSRLTGAARGDVEARRLHHARAAAEALEVTVLLKGSTTLVAAPDGQVRVNTAQTAALGTAGTGDVLSGVCATMLAAGLTPLDAGAAGAFLHGLAGVLAVGRPGRALSATDVIRCLPEAVAALRG